MLTPEQEAKMIVEALFEDLGTGGATLGPCPGVDGREAVLEMKKADFPGWQEVEWAGYHIKYLVQRICQKKLKGKIQTYSVEKRHLVKGHYIWDARFNANESKQVILGDVEEYNDIVTKDGNGGIGILIVDAMANYDLNEDFRRWHEEMKGGSSDYTVEREMEGRPVRIRKTEYMIRKVFAFFFAFEDFRKGIKEGWLLDNFQLGMRNWDGSPRKAKYLLKLDAIPNKYLLFVKNFNEDQEEFRQEFPNYA